MPKSYSVDIAHQGMPKRARKRKTPVLFNEHDSFFENETHISKYSCAIRREIMIQGRLVVTLRSVAFFAKFFKKNISIFINFKDVVDIKKEKTAYLFPNAIFFSCSGGIKYTFYSFLNRDKVFNLIKSIYLQNYRTLDSPSSDLLNTPSTDLASCSKLEEMSEDIINLFDVSDSSLPPEESVSCEGHSHPGKELVSDDYPLSAHKLFLLLFMNSCFIKCLFEKLNAYLISMSAWAAQGDTKRRMVVYNMKTSTSFGVIMAHIEEEQIIEPHSRLGAAYIIRTISHTKGVMYCDSFYTEMLYCITSNCPLSSHLRVHANLVMKPNTFVLARKLITSNGIAKIVEYCNHIQGTIKEKNEISIDDVESVDNTFDDIPETTPTYSSFYANFLFDHVDSAFITNLLLFLILVVLLCIFFSL